MRNDFRPVGLLIVAAFFALSLRSSPAQTKPGPTRIHVGDIGKSVVLIGRLGEPLGAKLRIKGRWHFPSAQPSKDYSIRFTVFAVNGSNLEHPVTFNIEQMNVSTSRGKNALPKRSAQRELAGQEWSMTAYETGRIQIFPDEYRDKHRVFPVVGRAYYTKPFTSSVVGVLAAD